MFTKEDIKMVKEWKTDYKIITSNCHDIRLTSRRTSHEWILISSYGGSACEIRHRHSSRDPFHRQPGRYRSLAEALQYIVRHDEWTATKKKK